MPFEIIATRIRFSESSHFFAFYQKNFFWITIDSGYYANEMGDNVAAKLKRNHSEQNDFRSDRRETIRARGYDD